MKRKFSVALALAMVLMLTLTSLAATVRLAYTDGALYLRKGPGKEYAENGTVHNGDKITVVNYGSVWSKVKTSDNRTGYIKNLYIKDGDSNYASGTSYYGGGYVAYITGSVNFRAGASTSTASMGMLSKGQKVTVLGKNGAFYLVKDSKGTQGYVHGDYLSKKKQSSGSGSSSSKTSYAYVTASSLNVRSGAGYGYGVIDTLPKNTKVTVLHKGVTWTQIKCGSTTGYVATNYLK